MTGSFVAGHGFARTDSYSRATTPLPKRVAETEQTTSKCQADAIAEQLGFRVEPTGKVVFGPR